jgi:hypothetical protein
MTCTCCFKRVFKTSCVKMQIVPDPINIKNLTVWFTWTFIFLYHWYVNAMWGGPSVWWFMRVLVVAQCLVVVSVNDCSPLLVPTAYALALFFQQSESIFIPKSHIFTITSSFLSRVPFSPTNMSSTSTRRNLWRLTLSCPWLRYDRESRNSNLWSQKRSPPPNRTRWMPSYTPWSCTHVQ